MKTHRDLLSKKCSHREFYEQFVNEDVKRMVKRQIGLKDLLEAEDKHLNDIKLRRWDMTLFPMDRDKIRASGAGMTSSTHVCIAKEAARQIIEEETGKKLTV